MDTGSNIKVVCRFRPLNALEVTKGGKFSISQLSEDSVVITTADCAVHQFTFDRVFGTNAGQEAVYLYSSLPIVKAVLQGFNGCLLAYGQTGAGKTHTMMGLDGSVDVEESDLGIIPRSIHEIFQYMAEADEGMEFSIIVSYVEIYQEKIRDLLDPSKDDLKIGEGGVGGTSVYVKDVTQLAVISELEVLEIMRQGSANRATAATGMNQGSSRSHSLFTLTLTQEDTRSGIRKSSKLYFVDLAGSETVSKTGVSGMQLEELKRINRSLSSLGLVINALTDGKSSHIPYRDSKLTRLLQDCLGGNSKTSLIMNCSPSVWNEMETLSTLRFGKRAKNIKNKPLVNLERSPEELKRYITALEARLVEYQRREREWLELYRSLGPSSPLTSKYLSLSSVAEREATINEVSQDVNAGVSGSMSGAMAHHHHHHHHSHSISHTSLEVKESSTASTPTASLVTSSSLPSPTSQSQQQTRSKLLSVDGDDVDGTSVERDSDDESENEEEEEDEEEDEDEETYEDLLAARDELESQNATMLDLLKEAGAELKSLRATVEARSERVRELQRELSVAVENATAAKDTLAFYMNSNSTVGANIEGMGAGAMPAVPPNLSGSLVPAGGSDISLEVLRSNYHQLIEEKEILTSELEDARKRVSELQNLLEKANAGGSLGDSAGTSAIGSKTIDDDNDSVIDLDAVTAEKHTDTPNGTVGAPKAEVVSLPMSLESKLDHAANSGVTKVVEEVWENQRYYPDSGWAAVLLASDPPMWSDLAGVVLRNPESVRLPPPNKLFLENSPVNKSSGAKNQESTSSSNNNSTKSVEGEVQTLGWYWCTPWRIESVSKEDSLADPTKHRTDREGWLYAASFDYLGMRSSKSSNDQSITRQGYASIQGGHAAAPGDCVRRRRWVRVRAAIVLEPSRSAVGGLESVLSLVQSQEELLARLQHELVRKGDIVSDYESRLATLSRCVADAAATGDVAALSPAIMGARVFGAGVLGAPKIRGGAGRQVTIGGSTQSGLSSTKGTEGGNAVASAPNSPSQSVLGDEVGFFRSFLRRISQSPVKSFSVPQSTQQLLSNSLSNGDNDNAKAEALQRALLWSAFFKACEEGDLEFVKNTYSSGKVPLSATDKSNRTGLLYASRGGQLAVVQFLVKAGCPLGSYDKDARNALAYASRRGHVEIASWLLGQGLYVNACDVHGMSPLHQAVLGKHTGMAELLLNAGADFWSKDSNGNTPYTLAKRFLSDDPDSKAILHCLRKRLKTLSKEQQITAGRDNQSIGAPSDQEDIAA